MQKFVVLHKAVGETPLEALEQWRREHPQYQGVALSYAGRLDPMASGLLLVLIGEECKRQQAYTKLDKEYEIEVLLGVGSDTGDVLGLVELGEDVAPSREQINAALADERGTHSRPYPHFSSKTVAGKPLFLHALENNLENISIPEHTEHLYALTQLDSSTISQNHLADRISKLLELVPHTLEPSKKLGEDFRIGKVRAAWQEHFAQTIAREYHVLKLRVVCASGAYMRALAGRVGKSLGTRALALSITRTKIGTYLPLFHTGVWLRTFRP